jgi:TonB family protein
METPDPNQEIIMRKVLVATLLALPSLVSAQAIHSVSHMLASVEAPAFAFQAGALKAGTPRIFSGLIAPIRVTNLQLAPSAVPVRQGEVVVGYTVNTSGATENVHIVKSLDESANARVIEAVRKMQYTPGQLDGQPVDMPITLHVAFTN